MSSYWEVAQVTKTERIEQLEREVAELRANMAVLLARVPATTYTPNYGTGTWTWPQRPYEVWCATTTAQVAA